MEVLQEMEYTKNLLVQMILASNQGGYEKTIKCFKKKTLKCTVKTGQLWSSRSWQIFANIICTEVDSSN